MTRTVWGWIAFVAALLIVLVWVLPINGQLEIPGSHSRGTLYPLIAIEPADAPPGTDVLIMVEDRVSWAYVKLTINGAPATFVGWTEVDAGQLWRWQWRMRVPPVDEGMTVEFFHDCHTGCQRRATLAAGAPVATRAPLGSPTKLCVDFADPARDWHNRQGWSVDMTYMRLADDEVDPYWGVDALAARVAQAKRNGLRMLVRVEYDRDQTLPPTEDHLALSEYLAYLQRLAQDDRLADVYGYIIGTSPNSDNSNQQAPGNPLTPAWVARILNGYGEDPTHHDNALAVIRTANPTVRVLVGPVRPWIWDQDADSAYPLDMPWLNYMDALAASLDLGAATKAQAGIAWSAPDGFAIQAPGRPLAPELDGVDGAEEPRHQLDRVAWNGAQAGFQVYREWITIIDRYSSLQGLPVYIKSTNTYTPDEGVPPAQNYPQGWLTTAYSVVNADPRVHAMCWFLDVIPGDNSWDAFSLSRGQGRLLYAAEEFDALLRQ